MPAKTEKLEFRCSPRLKDALERAAVAQEMTLSEIIRAACEDYTYSDGSFTVPLMGTISQQEIEWKSTEVKL